MVVTTTIPLYNTMDDRMYNTASNALYIGLDIILYNILVVATSILMYNQMYNGMYNTMAVTLYNTLYNTRKEEVFQAMRR